MSVVAERKKCLLGPIAGGRQPVGTQSDPGQQGNESNVPLRLLAEWIERRAEYDLADFPCAGQLFLPKLCIYARHFGVGASRAYGPLLHIHLLKHYSRWSAKANLPAR
jgi:hypothetical protein